MNFQEAIWVRAEILQAKESRGHTYLELIEKNDQTEGVCAQATAALWFKNKQAISQKLVEGIDDFLKIGTEVSLLVEVSFHSIYGLTLSVLDLDPAYTLGRMAITREKTIARLQKEQLLARNRSLELPSVLQRLAVVSAPTAAGYQDFVQQLVRNEYGYDFSVTLFPNAMQGVNVRNELLENLHEIARDPTGFDCLIIIRGGGSKVDLNAFDQYEIARAIALLKLPVLTGIGHETDQSVVDLVAHQSFKTPTAVAAFLVDRNLKFETLIYDLFDRLERTVQERLISTRESLIKIKEKSKILPGQIIAAEQERIVNLRNQLKVQFTTNLKNEWQKIEKMSGLLEALDPKSILARGFAYTRQDGMIKTRANEISEEHQLQIIYSDGIVLSDVDKKELI